MSETNIESVFSEQAAQPQEQAQEVAQEPVEQATGEEVAAAPAEPQEDQFEKHRKGLEAAAVAERNKRQAAEARAQALEAQLHAFQQQQQPAKAEGKPDPQDPRFQDNPQLYWEELAEYKADQAYERREKSARERQQEEQQYRAQAAFKERIDSVSDQGRAKYGDFDAVINAGLGPFLNATMQQAIALEAKGEDLAYWLGKNPAEAARISQMPPMLMVLELGRVSAKASTPAPSPIPRTLTDTRNAQGQYAARQSEHTPLDALFERK